MTIGALLRVYADTEPARHVHQFGVRFLARHLAWFERHTADRANSRLASHNLRVHWARVLHVGPGGCRSPGCGAAADVLLWSRSEFVQTALATEKMGPAVVLLRTECVLGRETHAAHGIGFNGGS